MSPPSNDAADGECACHVPERLGHGCRSCACLKRSSRLSVERRLCRRTWRHDIHWDAESVCRQKRPQRRYPGRLESAARPGSPGGRDRRLLPARRRARRRGRQGQGKVARCRQGQGRRKLRPDDAVRNRGRCADQIRQGRQGEQHRRMETRLSLRRRYRAGFSRRPPGQGRTFPARSRFCMMAPSGYWRGPGAARASAWNCRFGRDRRRRREAGQCPRPTPLAYLFSNQLPLFPIE